MLHTLHRLVFGVHRVITLGGLRRLLRSAQRAAPRSPQYKPEPGSILYVAASCLPYHISGYTVRTQEVIRAMLAEGAKVHALTRPGYPWDRDDRLASIGLPPERKSKQHSQTEINQCFTCFDTIEYAHEPRPSKYRPALLYAMQAAPQIMRRAVEARAMCIHAASNHINALPALLAARRLGLPFQYEMRGLWELSRASRQPGYERSPGYALGLELEGFVAAQADRVLVISEQLKQYAAKAWNIPPERIGLLPNCIDAERIRPVDAQRIKPSHATRIEPAGQASRIELNNEAVSLVSIGYAGSLVGYEGLDTLIGAIGILSAQERSAGPQVRLEIIGDGAARLELESLVERLKLPDRVRLHGRLEPDAARAMLAGCALVCIPRKPFKVCTIVPPIKLVEALAMGKPVIVPDLPVFRDELGTEPAGWFFQAGDAEDLARVITKALADPERLAALRARARAYVLEHRQWRGYVSRALQGFLPAGGE